MMIPEQLRTNRRNFLKGLAAMAGVTLLPLPEALPQAAPAILPIDQPLQPAMFADDRIWLDYDGKRYQLDNAQISMQSTAQAYPIDKFIKHRVIKQTLFIDFWLTNQAAHLAYLKAKNVPVMPFAIQCMLDDKHAYRLSGKAQLCLVSQRTSYTTMNYIIGPAATMELPALSLLNVYADGKILDIERL